MLVMRGKVSVKSSTAIAVLVGALVGACNEGDGSASKDTPPIFDPPPVACNGKLPPGMAVVAAEKKPERLSLRTTAGYLSIEPWSDHIVHVTAHATADNWSSEFNPAVIAKRGDVKWECSEDPRKYILSTAKYRVEVNKATARIRFLDTNENLLVEEAAAPRVLPAVSSTPEAPQSVTQSFKNAGLIYGLGQHQTGKMNHTGYIWLRQQNVGIVQDDGRPAIPPTAAIPMLISQKGYGILWNNTSITNINVPESDVDSMVISSKYASGIDYHFIYGPEIDDVVGGYRALTGDAPMMPKWAWGFWNSYNSYRSRSSLLNAIQQYRDKKIPVDSILLDLGYQTSLGAFDYNSNFPDPTGMVQAVHDQNMHFYVSIWPNFTDNIENMKEHEREGTLFPGKQNFYQSEARWGYDPFNPKGRDIYWKQIKKTLANSGVDGWWVDADEPEILPVGAFEKTMTAAGPGAKVFNSYPLMHTSGIFEGSRRDFPSKRVVMLTRSTYAGQQRNSSMNWSGDIPQSWEYLGYQAAAGLNYSVAGVPYWSSDIGGFFSRNGGMSRSDSRFPELYTRWFQFATFIPGFRTHGDSGKEIYSFDAQTQPILIKFDKLRYRLLPYIYSLSWNVTHDRGTMMRPLVMDFRTDYKALKIPDQFMFGKAILVNPVTREGANSRPVYLPGRDDWYDFWTGTRMTGGQSYVARAPIDSMPLYVRSGSILPLGPDIQHTGEKSSEATELRVYPGRDGAFELYDDAGDGYQYENGEYATTQLSWDDARKKLTIGARKGKYPGMAESQAYKVTCGTNQGASTPVTYTGAQLEVDLPKCGV